MAMHGFGESYPEVVSISMDYGRIWIEELHITPTIVGHVRRAVPQAEMANEIVSGQTVTLLATADSGVDDAHQMRVLIIHGTAASPDTRVMFSNGLGVAWGTLHNVTRRSGTYWRGLVRMDDETLWGLNGEAVARLVAEGVEQPSFPLLNELAKAYGPDARLDYVGDLWGDTPCTLTPAEAISLHGEMCWIDDGYRVLHGSRPGGAVLVDKDGAAILRLPE